MRPHLAYVSPRLHDPRSKAEALQDMVSLAADIAGEVVAAQRMKNINLATMRLETLNALLTRINILIYECAEEFRFKIVEQIYRGDQ